MLNGTVPTAPTLDPKDTQLLKALPAAVDSTAPVYSPVALLYVYQILIYFSPLLVVVRSLITSRV